MTAKVIAAVILSIIVFLQWVMGVDASIREDRRWLGVVLFTVWTIILYGLLYLAGVYDFK